ncbi:MAG: acyl-CoA thioester hydrolase [Salibacteraceae bacterium]|jgi:acyl-CoA thioester hydrolase
MFITETKLRVRYAETDRMGYAYYGNYATYFEVARVEALRSLGISYKQLEDDGVLLPVSEFRIKYKKPAYYDDELTIKVTIQQLPEIRFTFHYETFNAEGQLLNTAFIELVFVNKVTGKPMRIPEHLTSLMKAHF